MTRDPREALLGRWVHSHEEDNEDEMVFRPADHAFPPSRGRATLELRGDGSYTATAPGPVDVPEESHGHWSIEEDRLALDAEETDRPSQAWDLTAAEPDRLVVRRR